MQLLNTPKKIESKLIELINDCESVQIAVAWATIGHASYRTLIKNREKISRLVVGTHFLQTDPKFLRKFVNHQQARVISNSSELFHPKVYYFEFSDGWACLIGSANFTCAGTRKNTELMVLFSSKDVDNDKIRKELIFNINNYYNDGMDITTEYVKKYEEHYHSKKEIRKELNVATQSKRKHYTKPKSFIKKYYPELLENTYKIVSSRIWKSQNKAKHVDRWWFKFNPKILEKYDYIVFAGACDNKNQKFKLLKVESGFFKVNTDSFDINADGKMLNLYIGSKDFIDYRNEAKTNFEQFVI